MIKKRQVWRNSGFIEWEKATIHVLSHALSRGSAIFDVLRVNETEAGPAAFRLSEHLDRLFYSAKLLGMKIGYSKEEIQKAVLETAKMNALSQGLIKIMAYWSEETILKLVPDAELDIDIFAIPDAVESPSQDKLLSRACISKWRKIPPECSPVKAKACAHYLNGMLAHADAQSRGCDIPILLDENGFIAESAIKALFMVQDGILITPNQGWTLKSITRQTIMEIAYGEGIDVDERPVRAKEFPAMDECFASGSAHMVQAIGQVDDHVFKGAPGPLSMRISELCQKVVTGKLERYKKWLTYI
jgi:branched-chain amino acid aminotransferase